MSDTIALDDNFIPVSSGVVPNNAQRTAGLHLTNLQGPDSNGNYYGDLVTSLSGGTAVIGHVIVDSGTITANAGTNLNTSLLALESGGNLAGAKTDLDTLVADAPTKEVLTSTINGIPVDNFISSAGGPVNSSGLPQGPFFQRIRSLQGKVEASGTITSTNTGDTSLVFSVAPKSIEPGQYIRLSGATVEGAYVTDTYVPSTSTTTIPLQTALVQTGNTTATWDVYGSDGPGVNAILASGITPSAMVIADAGSVNYRLLQAADKDAAQQANTLAVNTMLYNGSGMDRYRGNTDNVSLVASGAYTTTQTTGDQTNFNFRGIIVTLDMTTVGTGSVTLEIDMKDPVSGKYVSLLTGAAVITNSTNIYTVYPGCPATSNVSANAPLPRTWRVKVTANNANSATYSVGASLIL